MFSKSSMVGKVRRYSFLACGWVLSVGRVAAGISDHIKHSSASCGRCPRVTEQMLKRLAYIEGGQELDIKLIADVYLKNSSKKKMAASQSASASNKSESASSFLVGFG